MRFIADFHIHSRYSRATSGEMNIENLVRWAKIKGINLLGTGDFTHPNYFAELRLRLEPQANGFLTLKKGDKSVHFILTTELSNIFSQNGRQRRIHTIIFAPSLEVVAKLNNKLKKIGNLSSDGRPIFGQSIKDMVKLILDTSPECFIVPAHVWTPWYSLFGANSGFDSIEECFQEEFKNIYCIETGLSSDPAMNWRLSALDKITLISNSDAHSPSKIGREANIFDCEFNYTTIIEVLKNKDSSRLLSTIEFFPQEGKYHLDGHRNCKVVFTPEKSKAHNNRCPVCKKPLTIGVMHRVDDLADRPMGFQPPNAIPAKQLVPLEEIIAEATGLGVGTTSVETLYHQMIKKGGNEFRILLDLSLEAISRFAPDKVTEGIKRVREGQLKIEPGFDGIYGKIKIFDNPPKSLSLFSFNTSTCAEGKAIELPAQLTLF